jgi:hypothetical protein
MNGTWMFVWHDEKALYDEVIWTPNPCSAQEAGSIAEQKMAEDSGATRVCVAYSPDSVKDLMRHSASGFSLA